MINSAIKQIALVVGSTLIAMAGVHAQTPCPIVSGDTTVSSSCDTGISLTGANLTIGTPTSGLVEVSNSGGTVISVSGLGNSINNTANGVISAGKERRYGIYNQGFIATLNNSGLISVEWKGAGIHNTGTITTLNNSESIAGAIGVVGIENYGVGATISTLNNSGTISVGAGGIGISNEGTINTLTNSGTISGGAGGAGIVNAGAITTLNNNSGTISAGDSGYGIYNGGTITTLTNSGTISADNSGYAIYNDGTITTLTNSGTITADGGVGIINDFGTINTLTNSGTISAGDLGNGIYNFGTINTLTNSGTISAGDVGNGIYNFGTITTLTNSGTISVGDDGYGIFNSGIINTLTNSGTISAGDIGYGILNSDTITTLTNAGTISAGSGGVGGVGIYNPGTITTLNNSGTISAGESGFGIYNDGTIESLTNNRTISAGESGYGIYNDGTIETLTNSGTISGGDSGTGIGNPGTIGTLSNAQGGNGSSPSTTALTYRGNLPTNYKVIINSASHYGQLAVTNPGSTPITNFDIYGAPFITSRSYSGVLSGTALPTGTSSGAYDNMTWALVANGGGFDLAFAGVSLMGTQRSIVNNAAALQNTYALQNSVLANSFSYDCPVFGEHNVCVSAGGRNTAVSAANGLNNTSALLIAAYRIKPTMRIGAYADQNLSVNNTGSTVNLVNSSPLIGLFGVWNQRIDGTGTEVKVSAAYGQKNTTVNRQIVGLSEAGTGSSNLNSQGAQITAKYGFVLAPDMLVSPYVGMRYTRNNMGGYTEATSSAVTASLTYSALNTNATTALAGAQARYRGIPNTTLFASAGLETDINTANGTYSATGVTGLTPVNFNPNPVKTRPTATVGVYYDITKSQRFSVTGIYRQEPFQAVSTTTVLATYTIGF
ncbi:Autotransporter beta-domain containing protein [Burkholderiaceae bacterium]